MSHVQELDRFGHIVHERPHIKVFYRARVSQSLPIFGSQFMSNVVRYVCRHKVKLTCSIHEVVQITWKGGASIDTTVVRHWRQIIGNKLEQQVRRYNGIVIDLRDVIDAILSSDVCRVFDPCWTLPILHVFSDIQIGAISLGVSMTVLVCVQYHRFIVIVVCWTMASPTPNNKGIRDLADSLVRGFFKLSDEFFKLANSGVSDVKVCFPYQLSTQEFLLARCRENSEKKGSWPWSADGRFSLVGVEMVCQLTKKSTSWECRTTHQQCRCDQGEIW
mmetsp:Transcript_17808/g.26034  ORF Transcript_17808/g.26034 Transcript_17808/m.26034 type:complete len:275 (+) Transcript_17808:193-1017(+)